MKANIAYTFELRPTKEQSESSLKLPSVGDGTVAEPSFSSCLDAK